MGCIEMTIGLAHSVFTNLSGKERLQKHEALLYSQACRTLQGYLHIEQESWEEPIDEGEPNCERS